MNPVVSKIRKRTQANDNNEQWKSACYNQCKQYMIMQGQITKQQLTKEYGKKLPKCYNPDKLPRIDDANDVWFDEMHIKQKAGLNMHADMQIRFLRDKSGCYNKNPGFLAKQPPL